MRMNKKKQDVAQEAVFHERFYNRKTEKFCLGRCIPEPFFLTSMWGSHDDFLDAFSTCFCKLTDRLFGAILSDNNRTLLTSFHSVHEILEKQLENQFSLKVTSRT